MQKFLDRRNTFLQTITKKLPQYDLLAGYGSGCFYQEGGRKDRMIDFIISVNDLDQFHDQNHKMNPYHYSSFEFMSKTDSWIISSVSKHFCPLFYFTQNEEEGVKYKYGVIQTNVLETEMKKWVNFGIAGRFQKPVYLMGPKTKHFESIIDANRADAVFLLGDYRLCTELRSSL